MKEITLFIILPVFVILMVGLYLSGWMHSVTSTVSLVSPKPGIECALATSDKGIALSCWQVAK